MGTASIHPAQRAVRYVLRERRAGVALAEPVATDRPERAIRMFFRWGVPSSGGCSVLSSFYLLAFSFRFIALVDAGVIWNQHLHSICASRFTQNDLLTRPDSRG